MIFLRMFGWGLLTIGVMVLVLPFLPSETGGEANNISFGSVALGIGMLLVGGLMVTRASKSS
jgi:hypothetical protein